jgi:hypothetical protein
MVKHTHGVGFLAEVGVGSAEEHTAGEVLEHDLVKAAEEVKEGIHLARQ